MNEGFSSTVRRSKLSSFFDFPGMSSTGNQSKVAVVFVADLLASGIHVYDIFLVMKLYFIV